MKGWRAYFIRIVKSPSLGRDDIRGIHQPVFNVVWLTLWTSASMTAGHSDRLWWIRTFTSFIRIDEGLRERGCQDWHVVLSPPTTPRRNMDTAIWSVPSRLHHRRLAMQRPYHSWPYRCLLTMVPVFPSTDDMAESRSSKAKSVDGFTGNGLLPCGFTTWQLRDRGNRLK